MTVLTHPSGYRIGAAAVTTDGKVGTVRALVVDPHTRAVTHLAVEPGHRRHRARLVPSEMATAEPGGDVRVACDRDGFDQLDELEQLGIIDVGTYESYWPAGTSGLNGYDVVGEVAGELHPVAVWSDRPPDGEVALRHGTPVRAGDETVGHLEGLLAGADGRITAVLVGSGHLWSRRTVAVPVDAVTEVDAGGVTIAGTWDQPPRRS